MTRRKPKKRGEGNDSEQDEDLSSKTNKLDPKNWKLTSAQEGTFECPECNEIFTTKKLRKKHRMEAHGIECPHCNKMIIENKMKNHINRCHTPVKCPLCEEICESKQELSKHKREYHDGGMASNINANTTGLKTKHKKQKQRYKCPHCGNEFTYNNYLNHDKKKCLQEKIDAFVYSKERDNLIDPEPIKIVSNRNKKKISCDLHELFLDEAKNLILEAIEQCILEKIEILEIIHGYKHGQVLKNYLRSEEFLKDFSRQRFKIQIIDKTDSGNTTVKIKPSEKKNKRL